ncbi:MAG: hypothetical protein ACK52J_04890 [bacterium]|jgi:hypothetical protein
MTTKEILDRKFEEIKQELPEKERKLFNSIFLDNIEYFSHHLGYCLCF